MKSDALPSLLQVVSVVAIAICASGCGESHPETYPVTGQVVFKDGSKLEQGGWVEFFRTEGSPKAKANGSFGPDGKFTLSTYGKDDGAIAGDYKVAVVAKVPDDREPGMSQAEYIKALEPISDRYKNPEASGLQYTVSPDTSPHDFRIEITRPSRKRRR